VVVPSAVYLTIIVTRVALRRLRGSSWMAVGLLLFSAMLIYALVLGWRGQGGGFQAILSFATLAFFQAVAASQISNDRLLASQKLTEKLRQSEAALAHQRKELEINLHDSLGGNLTDLKIFSERMNTRSAVQYADLEKLKSKVALTINSFRSQLLFMEDLELASEELLTGLQMTLLRRYSDAGREVDFMLSPELENKRSMLNDAISPASRLSLFLLVQEICTNDLKYGRGDSRWRLSALADGLEICQENMAVAELNEKMQAPGQRIKERVTLMQGECSCQAAEGRLVTMVKLPKLFLENV
jgi:glucose-6-phosphate-specific signal transduction histidine kinase